MRQISFSISEDENSLNGALTAYAREWILVAASELPEDTRSITALAESAGDNRQKVARWLDALGIRDQVYEMWE